MSSQYVFTVFTPTYNRAKTLHRTFESLCAQTFRDFEWLVIDNCSQDNTDKLMESFIKKADFPIRYLKQTENRGKHGSFNRGVREARGTFFWEMYSDDAFLPNSLERLKYHWENIPDADKPHFIGVTGLCQDQHGKLVVDQFPADVFDSDYAEALFRYRIFGEKSGFQRVEVLRKFLSPTIKELLTMLPFENVDALPQDISDSTSLVNESMMWANIARFYKTRYVNEFVRVFYLENNPDRLTLRKKRYTLLTSVVDRFYKLEYWHRFFWRVPIHFSREALIFHYVRYAMNHTFGGKFKLKLFPSVFASQSWFVKCLLLATAPLGFAIYLLKRKKW